MGSLERAQIILAETVCVLKWMVGKKFCIEWIDEGGKPWVMVDFPNSEGAQHSMAIMDSESWELAE